jgi:hypothetical protein
MVRISKQVKKAMDKAKKQVFKEASKPKKKRKHTKGTETKAPTSRWIKDEWGEQGEVFFDGRLYWLTLFKPGKGMFEAYPCGLGEDQWQEYKKKPIRVRLTEQVKSETSVIKEPLSSTQRKTKSTKSSKTRRKKSSHMNSGKTATRRKRN